MPTFNTPLEYLKESVESVLKQTFADFELLIIDDGSTGTTGIEWLGTLQDQRIRIIRNHHDFIDSLNRGIAESKGKYIARMDSDDMMKPNRLQRQYDFMEEHPEIDVCGSWMELFGNQNEIVKLRTKHKEIVTDLLLSNQLAHPTVMLRKTSVCKNETDLYKKGYDFAEDYKLWTDLAIKGLQFANIPEVLLKYRCSENQVTNTRQKEMAQSSLKIQVEYAEEVIEKIVKKEKKYELFFRELVKLCNGRFISIDVFLKTLNGFL
jgi:glycosyltransferase involved in cell wall biosynthesis